MKTFGDYADELFDFFAENGMDFGDDRPSVSLVDGGASRFDVFAPTGHYDWLKDEIVLYIGNRHAKDILRTLCHEMTHAWQYRRDPDAFEQADKSGNLSENEQLLEYESEAYKTGNVLFRMWTEREHPRK